MTVKEKETKYIFSSDRQDYKTPAREIINPIRYFADIEQFDFDTCCTDHNIPAKHYFSSYADNPFNTYLSYETFDGLTEAWSGICWMNPPFEVMDDWIKKAYNESKHCEVWSIIPARTETKYWKMFIAENPDCFVVNLRKGLSFVDPGTNDYCKNAEGKIMPYKNALAIVYFGKNAEELSRRWNIEQPLPFQAWRIAV